MSRGWCGAAAGFVFCPLADWLGSLFSPAPLAAFARSRVASQDQEQLHAAALYKVYNYESFAIGLRRRRESVGRWCHGVCVSVNCSNRVQLLRPRISAEQAENVESSEVADRFRISENVGQLRTYSSVEWDVLFSRERMMTYR